MKALNTKYIAGLVVSLVACGKSSAPPPDAAAPVAEVAAPSDDVAAAPADVTAEVAAFDRSKRPDPRAIAELKIATPETFTLPNGLQVYLLSTETLPTVAMTLEFDTGGATDPDNKVGLASVCMDLFSEGTERLDKVAWSEALADHALTIYSPAGLETSSIVMQALTSELAPGLDLLAELLLTPGLRQADFERIIADRKASLAQSRATVGGVGGRLIGSLIWGKQHPYGRVGHETHLDAMKLADCKAWVGQLKPDGARLWVAGKVTKAELETALSTRLAKWVGAAPSATPVSAAPPPTGTIFAVQIDGAVQSMVMVAEPGPTRRAEDYEATFLMQQIFGGSFSSRINMNLREAKGYAYGSSGRFTYRRVGSQFVVSASVEATTTVLSLREIAAEVKKMRDEQATEAELTRDREGALLALPARFQTAGDTLDELRSLAFYGLPFTWFSDYQARLKAVDLAAIQAAAKAHLFEHNPVVLVAGDFKTEAKDAAGKTLRDELQKLSDEKVFGAGGVVFLDADGNPQP